MRPVLYVVVNKSLNMSPGKVAAQVAHATIGAVTRRGSSPGSLGADQWHGHPHRWVIVLEANDALHLHHIERYLDERRVATYLVIDEGVNEIPALSATALGVEILDKDSQEAEFLSGLPLFHLPSWDDGWDDGVRYMWHRRFFKRLRNQNPWEATRNRKAI